jgi:hypothetical protein
MDEVDLIRELAPAVAPPDSARKDQARASLHGAMSARRRRWPSFRPRRAVVLALATGFLALALARGPFFWTLTADPAATAALEDAATVAAQAPRPLEIGDGFVYTKTDALWAFSSAEWTYLRPLVREFWIAADGSGRIRESVEEPIFLSEGERQTWLAGNFDVSAINEDFGPGELSSGYPPLPADVEELRDIVRELAEGSQRRPIELGMFVYIGDFLRDPLTPPDVRAGLFGVAATLPGIELLGPMRDEVGRAGIAVAMSDWFHQEIIIFDPESSALLEERTIRHVPYGDTFPPIVWSRSTYLESAVVPELPAE